MSILKNIGPNNCSNEFQTDFHRCFYLNVFCVKLTFLILILMRLYSLSFSPVSFGLFEKLVQ